MLKSVDELSLSPSPSPSLSLKHADIAVALACSLVHVLWKAINDIAFGYFELLRFFFQHNKTHSMI